MSNSQINEIKSRAEKRANLEQQVNHLGQVVQGGFGEIGQFFYQAEQAQKQIGNSIIIIQRILNDIVKNRVRKNPDNDTINYSWYSEQAKGASWFCDLINKLYHNADDQPEELANQTMGASVFANLLKKALTGKAQNEQGVFDRAEKAKELDVAINLIVDAAGTITQEFKIQLIKGQEPDISYGKLDQPILTIKTQLEDWRMLMSHPMGWVPAFNVGTIVFEGEERVNEETGQTESVLAPFGTLMSVVMAPKPPESSKAEDKKEPTLMEAAKEEVTAN